MLNNDGGLDIPSCLLLTAEQRRAAWERRKPPKVSQGITAPPKQQRKIRAQIRGRSKSPDEKNKRGSTPKSTKGMRWDLRLSRWVPDVPLAPPPPERDPRRANAPWRNGGAKLIIVKPKRRPRG
jgi:hypothetical protein